MFDNVDAKVRASRSAAEARLSLPTDCGQTVRLQLGAFREGDFGDARAGIVLAQRRRRLDGGHLRGIERPRAQAKGLSVLNGEPAAAAAIPTATSIATAPV